MPSLGDWFGRIRGLRDATDEEPPEDIEARLYPSATARYGPGRAYPSSGGSYGEPLGVYDEVVLAIMEDAPREAPPSSAQSTPQQPMCRGARLTAVREEAVNTIRYDIVRSLSVGEVGRAVDPIVLNSERVTSEIERHAKEIWAFIDRELR